MKRLLPLLALVPLAGCGTTSTIESRIRDHPAVFAAATPQQQQLVRQGYVDRGFPPELVLIALEKPTRATTDAATGEIRWYYHDVFGAGGSSVMGEARVTSIAPGSRSRNPTAVAPTAPGGRTSGYIDAAGLTPTGSLDHYILITFTDGVVSKIAFFRPP